MKDIRREGMWLPNLLKNGKYLKSRIGNKNKNKDENKK